MDEFSITSVRQTVNVKMSDNFSKERNKFEKENVRNFITFYIIFYRTPFALSGISLGMLTISLRWKAYLAGRI